MSQYIHDNTEDEFSHAAFINAYLVSKGEKPVDLDKFRTLKGSQGDRGQQNKIDGSPISCGSKSTRVGGRGIAAAPITLILTRRSCSRRRSRACSLGSFRQSPEPTPTSLLLTTSRPSPTPRHSISLHRAGWQQPLPDLGPESNPSRGLANPAQHRPDRDHSLPDLARQSRQRGFAARGSSDRSALVFPNLNAPPGGEDFRPT